MFSIVYLSNKSWAIPPVLSANAPCLPLSTGSHILKLRDDSRVLTDFSHPTAFTRKILSHKSCILKRWWVKQYLLWNTEHYLPTAFVEGILKQNNWIKKYHGIVVSQYFASIIKMHALRFKNVMCRETHTYFTGSLTLIFLKFLLIELILTLTRLKKIQRRLYLIWHMIDRSHRERSLLAQRSSGRPFYAEQADFELSLFLPLTPWVLGSQDCTTMPRQLQNLSPQK